MIICIYATPCQFRSLSGIYALGDCIELGFHIFCINSHSYFTSHLTIETTKRFRNRDALSLHINSKTAYGQAHSSSQMLSEPLLPEATYKALISLSSLLPPKLMSSSTMNVTLMLSLKLKACVRQQVRRETCPCIEPNPRSIYQSNLKYIPHTSPDRDPQPSTSYKRPCI